MKYLLVVVLFLVIIGGVVALNLPQYNSDEKIIKQLSHSQIDKMIELGLIKVYVNLNHNKNDKEIGLVYKTQNGDCNLYKDIFGRYYCRW